MPAKIIQTNDKPFNKATVDPITLDIIENALRTLCLQLPRQLRLHQIATHSSASRWSATTAPSASGLRSRAGIVSRFFASSVKSNDPRKATWIAHRRRIRTGLGVAGGTTSSQVRCREHAPLLPTCQHLKCLAPHQRPPPLSEAWRVASVFSGRALISSTR